MNKHQLKVNLSFMPSRKMKASSALCFMCLQYLFSGQRTVDNQIFVGYKMRALPQLDVI